MTPIELIYYIGYSLKKSLVLKDQKSLPYPVISIGNITVGGTGKTPAVIAIAEEAVQRGYYPVILTRGYMGRAKGPCLVSKGSGRLLSVADAGDEPVLLAERLSGVPVVKSADRYAGGMFALDHLEMERKQPVFILDDGFQHWRLARDIDIVLIDGINPFGNRKLLPLGPLRGPLAELKKADVLAITKVKNESLAAELKAMNTNAPVYFSEYKATGLRNTEGRLAGLSNLEDKKVFALCGIANPDSFRNTLQQTGSRILELKSYRDHYRYAQKDMDDVANKAKSLGADLIVTTEKDMVKIRELSHLPSDLYALEIGFSIDKGFFDDIFRRINTD
jgi:tetraacyldisaccharide 4'-kinase